MDSVNNVAVSLCSNFKFLIFTDDRIRTEFASLSPDPVSISNALTTLYRVAVIDQSGDMSPFFVTWGNGGNG